MIRLLAFAPGIVAAAALASASLSGCSQCSGVCEAPAMYLELCEAARANLSSAEASGACRINGSDLYVTTLNQEGDCHVVLHYRDGTRSEIHATISYVDDSCCRGYYPDRDHRYFVVPHPACQGWVDSPDASQQLDAASCPYPHSGCYTHPDFADCGCRCKGWDVPTAGVGTYPNSGCSVGCSCGFSATEDYDWGCTQDADCVLVRAGCCPCTKGGASMAVLKTKQLAWEDGMVAHCAPSGEGSFGCPEVDVCAGRKAVCDRGSCRALQP